MICSKVLYGDQVILFNFNVIVKKRQWLTFIQILSSFSIKYLYGFHIYNICFFLIIIVVRLFLSFKSFSSLSCCSGFILYRDGKIIV